MVYIKHIHSQKSASSVGGFNKVDFSGLAEEQETLTVHNLSEEEVMTIVDAVLRKSVHDSIFDECKLAITENICIDWYSKESVLSKMRIALTDAIVKTSIPRTMAKSAAAKIVSTLVTRIREISTESAAENCF